MKSARWFAFLFCGFTVLARAEDCSVTGKYAELEAPQTVEEFVEFSTPHGYFIALSHERWACIVTQKELTDDALYNCNQHVDAAEQANQDLKNENRALRMQLESERKAAAEREKLRHVPHRRALFFSLGYAAGAASTYVAAEWNP